jgi:glycosyltransferase involved in cell wall biosynthesis
MILMVVHNRNHVRLFAPSAQILRGRGLSVRFAHLEYCYGDEGAVTELGRLSVEPHPFAQVANRLRRGDVVAVANDWGPDQVVDGLKRAAQRGATLFGLVEGCKAADPRRYRLVHRILALGPASADLFGERATVVGSPIVERALTAGATFETPPFAVVNDKFVYDAFDRREGWLAAAERACAANGLRCVTSPHPSGASFVAGGPDFFDLISRAALLITRPSTVALEAMACGKPVVLFPAGNEDLFEFADAGDAVEVADDSAELAAAVARAVAAAPGYRARCRPFLVRHVAFDPARPAALKIADALAAALAAGRP